MAHSNIIHTLNYEDWYAGGYRREQFLDLMKDGLTGPSFFLLKNHGVPDSVIDAVENDTKIFFDMPLEKRLRYHYPETGRQIGYTPYGIEKGDGALRSDHKHFWQTGDLFEFLEVEEIEGFKEHMEKFFNMMRSVYQTLTRPLSHILLQEEEFLLKKEGNNTLRIIDYPARDIVVRDERDEVIAGGNAAGFCAYKHKDINVLTLLPRVQKGLELFYLQKWLGIPVDLNCFVVNAGLMLEHISNGYIKAGPHQVVCEAGIRRGAKPFFAHVMPRAYITPLSGLNGDPDLEKYPFKFSHDYLMDVLVKIGLLDKPVPLCDTVGGNIVIEDNDDGM